jgi:hypothetical protein
MRTLVTVYLYRHIRTHYGAGGTTGTLAITVEANRQIAIGIQLVGKGNCALRTEGHANLASLAKLPIDLNIAFSFLHSNLYLHKKKTGYYCMPNS